MIMMMMKWMTVVIKFVPKEIVTVVGIKVLICNVQIYPSKAGSLKSLYLGRISYTGLRGSSCFFYW